MKDEEVGNRSNRAYLQEPDTEEIQRQPLQTLDEELTQPSSQIQPNPYQLMPPVELQEINFEEEDSGSSNTAVVTRRANGALQEGQINDKDHKNHQQSDMMLV